MQSLTEVYQAERLRHAAGAAGMLPAGTDADPDSVLDSPFAWQVLLEMRQRADTCEICCEMLTLCHVFRS